MACQELIELLRTDVGDDNPANERFTNDQLINFIKVALKRLNRILGWTFSVVDEEITPTPTDAESDLILLQVECILATRERNSAIRKGIRARQDDSEIDTSAGLTAYLQSVAGEGGICSILKDALLQYQTSAANGVAANYGEIIWRGNSDLYNDASFNGQGNERLFRPGEDGNREGETGDFDGRTT